MGESSQGGNFQLQARSERCQLGTFPNINEKSDFETFHVAMIVLVKGQNDHLPHTQTVIVVGCQIGNLPLIVGEWTKCPLTANRHKKSSGHFDHLKTEEADRHTSIRFKYRYAVFCSFSGGACSRFASRKAFFRSPCRLICAAYRQSSEQYLTLFRVVVNTLPQCSQVSSRLRSLAASCR